MIFKDGANLMFFTRANANYQTYACVLLGSANCYSATSGLITYQRINVLTSLRQYDMNGRSHMQGGKNWILPIESLQTGSSQTLIGWKFGKTTCVPLWDRMEGAWLWTLVGAQQTSGCI
jgi:hypothetical protein